MSSTQYSVLSTQYSDSAPVHFPVRACPRAPASLLSCPVCYTQAALCGARTIKALKSGILLPAVQPTLGSVGMISLIHRTGKQGRCIEGDVETRQDW